MPRKLKLNIKNLLLLSKDNIGYNEINISKIDKNLLRKNIKKENYTSDVNYFKDKVSDFFFNFLLKFHAILCNAKYEVQTKESFFKDLDYICDKLKKPIIFCPIFNIKSKDNKYIEQRMNINNYLKEYVSKNNHLLFSSSDILKDFEYAKIFKHWDPVAKWEIERFGKYDTNHLSKYGENIISNNLKKFLNNL